MFWLLTNPIADMYGPYFLLFYGVVIAVTLGIAWWMVRRYDPTADLPPPQVPYKPDPYEIAYLRGGVNEVVRAAIVSLTQRGYVRVTQGEKLFGILTPEERIERASNPPELHHLSPIEEGIYEWFSTPRTAKEIFESESQLSEIKSSCDNYEKRLKSEQLLTSEENAAPA